MDSIVEPSNAEQAEWLNTTREYVQSLQAQLAQYEADAVHTCGEACQRPLCVLRAENAALREGITKIAEGDVPRVIFDHWRKDKAVSKHDLCPHQLAMYQDCGNCISDYARALLGKEQS